MRKRRLAKILTYLLLEFAAFGGVPMRPDEIEELLQATHRPRVAQALRRARDGDDDPPEASATPATRAG